MSDQGGDEMNPFRHRRTSPSSSPLDDDDLLGEILLRLPLQPSSLPRASLVSKPWRRLATDAAFLRHFRAHHRNPPVLGLFGKQVGTLNFIPVLDPPDCIPRERFSLRIMDDKAWDPWSILGCRHGRVLIFSRKQREILVFDPFSGDRRTMAVPPEFVGESMFAVQVNGAVLCAAGDEDPGHVHGSCHLSPFKVVLVCTRLRHLAVARVYSSKTGTWGDLVSSPESCFGIVSVFPCTLVGNNLYWWLSVGILEFDLGSQILAVINKPPFDDIHSGSSKIIRGDNGGVRIAVLLYPSFQLWDRKVDSHGIATWVLQETFNMHEILDLPYDLLVRVAFIAGYSEDAGAIFVSVVVHGRHRRFFIVRLESMQPTELSGNFAARFYHPFTNFYSAGQPLLQLPATENYVWGDDRA